MGFGLTMARPGALTSRALMLARGYGFAWQRAGYPQPPMHPAPRLLSAFLLWALPVLLCAQTAQPPEPPPGAPVPPAWSLPGSATHRQVAPPPDFRRASTHFPGPIGRFDGQSEVGSALVFGDAACDEATGRYTIVSAGYNIWYTRDEFRFLWKKMSGDVSLAADITFPDPKGYGDRKAVLVIRQDLDDDAQCVVVALHGLGMIQLAERPEKGARMRDLEFRVGGRGSRPGGASPDSLVTITARRLGLEKRGDSFALFVSLEGEPMTQYGPPITVSFHQPFYVGIGFSSHLPVQTDTAVLANVVLENAAGKVR